MNPDEMLAFAAKVRDGGKFTRVELVSFMTTLLDETAPQAPATKSAKVHSPPFEISRTPNGGCHLPRDANRGYTRDEALALAAEIARVVG